MLYEIDDPPQVIRPVAAKSLALIAKGLSRVPVLEVIDSLIKRDRADAGLD